jgi:hypothetical protein
MVDDDNLKGKCAFATRFTMSQSVVFTCDLNFEPFDLCQLRAHYSNEQSSIYVIWWMDVRKMFKDKYIGHDRIEPYSCRSSWSSHWNRLMRPDDLLICIK